MTDFPAHFQILFWVFLVITEATLEEVLQVELLKAFNQTQDSTPPKQRQATLLLVAIIVVSRVTIDNIGYPFEEMIRNCLLSEHKHR